MRDAKYRGDVVAETGVECTRPARRDVFLLLMIGW